MNFLAIIMLLTAENLQRMQRTRGIRGLLNRELSSRRLGPETFF